MTDRDLTLELAEMDIAQAETFADFKRMDVQSRVAFYMSVLFFLMDDKNVATLSQEERRAAVGALAYGTFRDLEAKEFFEDTGPFVEFGPIGELMQYGHLQELFDHIDNFRNSAQVDSGIPGETPSKSDMGELYRYAAMDADMAEHELWGDVLIDMAALAGAGGLRGAVGKGVGGALAHSNPFNRPAGARLLSILAGVQQGLAIPTTILRGGAGGFRYLAQKSFVNSLLSISKKLLIANVTTGGLLTTLGVILNQVSPQAQEHQESVAIAMALAEQGGFTLPELTVGEMTLLMPEAPAPSLPIGTVLPDGRVVGDPGVPTTFVGPQGEWTVDPITGQSIRPSIVEENQQAVTAQQLLDAGYVGSKAVGGVVGAGMFGTGEPQGTGVESGIPGEPTTFGTYTVGQGPNINEADVEGEENPYIGGYSEDYIYKGNLEPDTHIGVTGRAPMYRAADLESILGNMTERELIEFQEKAVAAKLINPNAFGWTGPGVTVDKFTIDALQEIIAIANGTGERWEAALETRIEQAREFDLENDLRAPFRPNAYLALDPARAAQEIKGMVRQQLRRDPQDWEIALLTEQLMKDHRASHDANEEARLNEWEHEGYLLEEPGPDVPIWDPSFGAVPPGGLPTTTGRDVPESVQGVDFGARFAERFEASYADEIDRNNRVAQVKQGTRNLMARLNRVQGMFSR
jgi:hypothetical protein